MEGLVLLKWSTELRIWMAIFTSRYRNLE